jgi:arylformamidase
MRIHDITVPLSPELPVYPGDSPVTIAPWTSIADGDAANVARITLCTHSGTHLDAPRHFNQNGLSVDNIPLEILIGKALVVEISGMKEIGRQDLERLPLRGAERLLLKTDNTALWKEEADFNEHYVSLSLQAAQYVVESGVKLLGIDYISVESVEGDGSVHRMLLDGGVLILEGVNLTDVAPGEYELICLPLKVKDGDGAPVRAILRGDAEPHHAHPDFDPHTTKWPLA